jgi:thiosulfate/3-mercaptopyruvate sulfurtransferase
MTYKPSAENDLLWSPERLAGSLTHGTSQGSGHGVLKVLDVRLGEAFAMGHIDGAIHFSVYGVNTYDSDPAPLRSFAHMWAFLLSQRGITPEDEVVVCGNVSGMSAARAFWFLEYLGYTRVHLLDGGFQRWFGEGRSVTRDAVAPTPKPCRYELIPSRVASHADVLAAIDDPDVVILDTRSRAEWLGQDARATRNGTIPGAIHQDWNAHLSEAGCFELPDRLASLFSALGCTPDKEVIAFCNTGYRSAHAYLALRLLGYPRVRNYVGSWQEWGNREGCPVVVPAP